MNVLRFLPVIVVLLGLVGCDETTSWRQKMTVIVDTPSGEKSGSSVIAVEFRRGSGQYDGSSVHWGIKGEAVVVEVAEGKYLFALLRGQTLLGQAGINASYAFARGGNLNISAGAKSSIQAVLDHGKDAPKQIPEKMLPLLVTFEDIAKPETVKRVYPHDFKATFGEGYALKSITLEITNEPVTTGQVEKVLGWLGLHPEPRLGPATKDPTNIPFYRRVSHGDFIRRSK